MTARALAAGLVAVLLTVMAITWGYASAPAGTLVLRDPTSTPAPALSPTHSVLVATSYTPSPLPTRPPVVPTVTPTPQLVDLNFANTAILTALGLSPSQARAVFLLRCKPAESPFVPFSAELEGCGQDATGIVRLRQIVDEGILTAYEVTEYLSGKVTQTWD